MKKDLWVNGTYLDLWSVVHTLSGVFGGLVALFFSISFMVGFVAFCALAVLWEGFEYSIKVHETKRNRVTDVVLGAAGFVGSVDLFATGTNGLLFTAALLVGCVLLVMNYLGWRSYRRRQAVRGQ